jgi:opacity protein-like surface antigen
LPEGLGISPGPFFCVPGTEGNQMLYRSTGDYSSLMNLLLRDNSMHTKQRVTSRLCGLSYERVTRPHLRARYLRDARGEHFGKEGPMTLKQSFAGAVGSVALMSAAQAADMQPVLKAPPVEQQATGYVEIYSGWAGTRVRETQCGAEFCEQGDPFRLNGWVLGGAGRGNYWITRDVSVQVDAQADSTSYDNPFGGGRFSNHSYLIGGHWSWRNPQQYLFGLFAAAGDAGGSEFSVTGPQRHALIGGEAQWYWSQFTLYAQVGYDSTLSNNSHSVHAWFIRGTGRYFVNPNFLIEGTVMYANGDIDYSFGVPSLGFQTWTWQAKAEWRFPTAPFSVFAKYQGSETKVDLVSFSSAFDRVTDHRVLFGLKLHMGDRTLQQTDRTGATLDIVSPLANPTSPLMFGGEAFRPDPDPGI